MSDERVCPQGIHVISKGIADCQGKLDRKDRAIEALDRYLSAAKPEHHGYQRAQSHLAELRSS